MRHPSRWRPSGLVDGVLRRQIARVHDLQRMVEHPLAHEVRVEPAGRGVAVVRRQPRGQRFRAVDVDPPAAARPQEELDEPLEIRTVGRGLRMRLGQHPRLEAKDRAVGLLEGDPDGHARPPSRRPARGTPASASTAGRKPGSRTGVTRGATSGRPLFVFMVEATGTCGRNLSIRRPGPTRPRTASLARGTASADRA